MPSANVLMQILFLPNTVTGSVTYVKRKADQIDPGIRKGRGKENHKIGFCFEFLGECLIWQVWFDRDY